jgi:superfamily II DNA or RNA helicase
LLDRCIEFCAKKRIKYEVVDQRDPFPPPQMHLAKGFRGKQFSSFIQMLKHNRSGIGKFPTRWGKSTILANLMRVFPGVPTVLAAPGVDLMNQIVAELRIALPGRTISSVFSGSKGLKGQCDDITVCSLDSLDKLNPEDVRLLLIDEPHAIAAPSRILGMQAFRHARIIGVGATTTGRFDGADILVEGLIGPVLYEKTFREAVAEGAICPIRVYVVTIPFDMWPCSDRDTAYRRLLYHNPEFNRLIEVISSQIIPQDWQTLIFADQQKQIDLIKLCVEDGVTAIASRMGATERKEKFEAMKAGTIKRCIATNIYSTGVTFPDLRCVINAAGGGGSITGTQKPGRLAQIRPGKKAGYLFDFQFVPKGWDDRDFKKYGPNDKWCSVVIDCQNRIRVYRETGFDVRTVTSLNQITID